MQHPLDRVLVAAWLHTRDENVFRLLYRRHEPALRRSALRLCKGDAETAADIVQDAWIRAAERLGQFEWRSSLRTWLTGILVNRWRESLRRLQFEKNLFTDEIPLHFAEKSPDLQAVMDVREAIRQLPDGYRALLVLHDLEGFKHEEIAEMLGISEGTCKSRLHHARKAFRNLIHEK